ncbi:MAG: transposase, partial [Bdellovibrionia bacterium]
MNPQIKELSFGVFYKRRWAVELLFRWLKSHLEIRYLAVKDANAVKIQLAVAVLIQLLLQLKKILTDYQGTLWELLRSLRTAQTRQFLASQRFLKVERLNPARRAK